MNRAILKWLLILLLPCGVEAFDAKDASTGRFIVSCVESGEMPSLSVISNDFNGKKEALELETRLIAANTNKVELEQFRRKTLRDMYFAIRMTDTTTGNTYEVQKDRRTIIARTKDGKELWRANPFVDAKLKPYRVDYPYIVYFGKPVNPVRDGKENTIMQINFDSSQFGGLDLKDGTFKIWGQD